MTKIKKGLNSPFKIGAFALGVIIVLGAVAFASMQVGASVNANKTIGLDKGVNVALQDAGFRSEDIEDLSAHYDNDDGTAAYEVAFVADGFEYEYIIKASDGTILKAGKKSVKKTDAEQQVQQVQQVQPAENDDRTQVVQQPEPEKETKPASSEKPASKYIGADKAKSIALSNAGLKASEVTFTKAKLDNDDGIVIYEIEFYSGYTEYEYEINAVKGTIIDRDIDHDDDWDDDWDDDDWD